MQTRTRTPFTTVKTEGALLPADLLQRVAAGEAPGMQPQDYHLGPGERINEAINRSWNRLLGVWQGFDEQRRRLDATETGVTLTRERWLLILFQELGYGRLTFQRSLELADGKSYPISHMWEQTPIHLVSFIQKLDDRDPTVKRSPHSLLQEFLNRSDKHLWGFVSNGLALRVLRDNASLTRAAYVEFDLEQMMTGEHYADFSLLWLVCHQSRVEIGEQGLGIGDRETSADDDGDPQSPVSNLQSPSSCWLERWSQGAVEEGTRALDDLRTGVQEAISALGRGFLQHRANDDLRGQLKRGDLTTQDYYRELLRLVYRLIFLFVAEDRELLLLPGTPTARREQYSRFYSLGRLRGLAERRRGGPHPDLYRSLGLLFLHLRDGYAPLGLPGLGGFLFSDRATPGLDELEIANSDLLAAIRALAFTRTDNVLRGVDYRNLGTEELGSVYESLLELHPHLNVDGGSFALDSAAGSERKTTGSYYTPTSLITSLLDSALEPVVAARLEAVKGRDQAAQEEALLAIKVVDPACGSGHFLIAAANRLALHLARIRTGDDEPGPSQRRHALREVVHRCIHGVDINPMSVELCKVALWMESLDPGRPLGFLDRNIQCGNSLLGATPALLGRGIPDDAFKPILGDDKEYASRFRKQNKAEQAGQRAFDRASLYPWERLGNLAAAMLRLDQMDDDSVEGVRRQEELYAKLVNSSDYRTGRLWADAWAAAFVWVKRGSVGRVGESSSRIETRAGQAAEIVNPLGLDTAGNSPRHSTGAAHSPLPSPGFSYPITEQIFREMEKNPYTCDPWMVAEIERLAAQYQFFHWHLAFPQIFKPVDGAIADDDVTGWTGGFDVVLGNPPWEKINLKDEEFFATSHPEIANAANKSVRKRMIDALETGDPDAHQRYQETQSMHDRISQFFRVSGRFPFTGVSRINLYSIFSELAVQNVSESGRVGLVLASGIVTDDNNKELFEHLMMSQRLVSVWDFENREAIFPAVDSRYKFCAFCASGKEQRIANADFAFYLTNTQQLKEPDRHFSLSHADLRLINPNTRTAPTFRNKSEAEITKAIYRRIRAWCLHQETEFWPGTPRTPFNMSNDSGLFVTSAELERLGASFDVANCATVGDEQYLSLYESKFTHQFNHRYASIDANSGDIRDSLPDQLSDPCFSIYPQYWMEASLLEQRFPGEWFLGYRMITNATNERTGIIGFFPKRPSGNSMTIIDSTDAPGAAIICSNMNSFVHDYVARQKVPGTNFNHWIWKQLPVPTPQQAADLLDRISPKDSINWLLQRVIELSYTAYDLRAFALDCGYHSPPFRWDEERRFLLRCELDAAYFHLYGIERDDVDYILETFPIVKRKDMAAHGEFRTKRVILEIYDEMARAMAGGQPYHSRLDPPPAHPAAAHPWDETYLGPRLDESAWWQASVGQTEDQRRSSSRVFEAYRDQAGKAEQTADGRPQTAQVKETQASYATEMERFALQQPPAPASKPKSSPPTPPPVIQPGLTPYAALPPTGSYQERLRRVLALAKASSDGELRELAAFLADEDGQIRWLAGGTVARVGGMGMVSVLADFLAAAEPERAERARPEMVRALRTIAESGEGAVAEGARGVLEKAEG